MAKEDSRGVRGILGTHLQYPPILYSQKVLSLTAIGISVRSKKMLAQS
jgi:hypothetical protein